MKKTKVILSFAFGASLALSVFQFTPAKALSKDGSCGPMTDWVCGLNGTNYNNKVYYSSTSAQE